jgi:hypothetical protein
VTRWFATVASIVIAIGTVSCAANRASRQDPELARAPRSGTVVEITPIRLHIITARTAQLFHIVDQISSWSPFTHSQYRRWAESWPLTADDRRMLDAHARMRRARGWGNGFERAFYVELPVAEAAERAVATGLLTDREAHAEADILDHFAPRIDPFIRTRAERLAAFVEQLRSRAGELRAITMQLARFLVLDSTPIDIPTVLIANGSDQQWGGGFNGGILTMEISPTRDVTYTIVHEALHAMLAFRQEALTRAATSANHLDEETLSEGIAHALAPGLLPGADRGDALREAVDRDRASGLTLDDPHARFDRYGLALRPLLDDALHNGTTLDEFLPLAIAAWDRLRAEEPTPSSSSIAAPLNGTARPQQSIEAR